MPVRRRTEEGMRGRVMVDRKELARRYARGGPRRSHDQSTTNHRVSPQSGGGGVLAPGGRMQDSGLESRSAQWSSVKQAKSRSA